MGINSKKERLDLLLVKRGFFESREQARTSIMCGNVFVSDVKEDKPGTNVNQDCDIYIKDLPMQYVSRGGLKLKKALTTFSINLKDKIVMDVGASTGGFTDCMLQNGAIKVIAIDVGYGQLAWKLRNDPKVVCMEKTNIRYVEKEQIGCLVDFVTADVAFISLKKVIPVVINLSNCEAEFVFLIKPQFEAGRDKVGKNGVVRCPEVHQQVLSDIANFCIELNLNVNGIDFSPITGPKGNIEYLLYASKIKENLFIFNVSESISTVVRNAHIALIT